MTKTLWITRWGIGGVEDKHYDFEDEAVIEVLDGGNVCVLDEPEGTAVAFFGGIAEARWTE